MKRTLTTLSLAALMLASTSAFAAPAPDRDRGHRGQDRSWQQDRRHDRHDRDDRYDRYDRRHDRGRHLGWYKQAYRRGQRVPAVYLQPHYYVNDYRAYRLSAPPPGYRWVRPYRGSDEYLLVQVATGLIMQVLGY